MNRIREFSINTREVVLTESFATSQDAAVRTHTRIVYFTLRAETGHVGTGECVVVPRVTGETYEGAVGALEKAGQALVGEDCYRLSALRARVWPALCNTPAALAAAEIALWDLKAQLTGQSWWEMFGGAIEEVQTDVTLALVEDALSRADSYARLGFHLFKVKVGRANVSEDLDLLKRVSDRVPGAVFRLDANEALTAKDALNLVHQALAMGLVVEFLEQPVGRHDLEGLDTVARNSPVPVLADEAVLTPSDALRVVTETAVHGVNVKLMKSGVQGALDIIAIVRAAGRRLMLGCMLETPRAIAFSLSLGAGTGAFDYYDLDGHLLIPDDARPYFEQDGMVLRIIQR